MKNKPSRLEKITRAAVLTLAGLGAACTTEKPTIHSYDYPTKVEILDSGAKIIIEQTFTQSGTVFPWTDGIKYELVRKPSKHKNSSNVVHSEDYELRKVIFDSNFLPNFLPEFLPFTTTTFDRNRGRWSDINTIAIEEDKVKEILDHYFEGSSNNISTTNTPVNMSNSVNSSTPTPVPSATPSVSSTPVPSATSEATPTSTPKPVSNSTPKPLAKPNNQKEPIYSTRPRTNEEKQDQDLKQKVNLTISHNQYVSALNKINSGKYEVLGENDSFNLFRPVFCGEYDKCIMLTKNNDNGLALFGIKADEKDPLIQFIGLYDENTGFVANIIDKDMIEKMKGKYLVDMIKSNNENLEVPSDISKQAKKLSPTDARNLSEILASIANNGVKVPVTEDVYIKALSLARSKQLNGNNCGEESYLFTTKDGASTKVYLLGDHKFTINQQLPIKGNKKRGSARMIVGEIDGTGPKITDAYDFTAGGIFPLGDKEVNFDIAESVLTCDTTVLENKYKAVVTRDDIRQVAEGFTYLKNFRNTQ